MKLPLKTSLNHGFRFEHFYGGTTTSVVTTAPTTKSKVLYDVFQTRNDIEASRLLYSMNFLIADLKVLAFRRYSGKAFRAITPIHGGRSRSIPQVHQVILRIYIKEHTVLKT